MSSLKRYVNEKVVNNTTVQRLRQEEGRVNAGEIRRFIERYGLHNMCFNMMYLLPERGSVAKTYYEAYVTYSMLLSTVDLFRDYLAIYQNTLEEGGLPEIREEITGTPSIPHIDKNLIGRSMDPYFGKEGSRSGSGSRGNRAKRRFAEYVAKPNIFTFRSSGQIPPFQHFCKYIRDRRVQRLFLQICKQYTGLKKRLLDVTVAQSREPLYGLLAYGYLFLHPNQPSLVKGDLAKFTDPRLYDMSQQKVNLAEDLSKRVYQTYSTLVDRVNAFHEGAYREWNLMDLLEKSMEMDLKGLEMYLFYVHPKYLRKFLREKDAMDNRIYGYVEGTQTRPEEEEVVESLFPIPSLNTKGLFTDFNHF
jgi:hypothetical protein